MVIPPKTKAEKGREAVLKDVYKIGSTFMTNEQLKHFVEERKERPLLSIKAELLQKMERNFEATTALATLHAKGLISEVNAGRIRPPPEEKFMKIIGLEKPLLMLRMFAREEKKYKHFEDRLKKIISPLAEQMFESEYLHAPGLIYHYPAPEKYPNIFYELAEHVGPAPKKPEKAADFKKRIARALEGKNILELGCGPGNYLLALKSTSPKAFLHGVELRKEPQQIAVAKGLDVVRDNAEHLNSLFPGKKFDVIFSENFFSTAVLDHDASKRVAEAMFAKMKPGAVSINQFFYLKTLKEHRMETIKWACKQTGLDFESTKKWFESLPEEEQERLMTANQPSLAAEDFKKIGFDVVTFGETADNYFTIVLKKPSRPKT